MLIKSGSQHSLTQIFFYLSMPHTIYISCGRRIGFLLNPWTNRHNLLALLYVFTEVSISNFFRITNSQSIEFIFQKSLFLLIQYYTFFIIYYSFFQRFFVSSFQLVFLIIFITIHKYRPWILLQFSTFDKYQNQENFVSGVTFKIFYFDET